MFSADFYTALSAWSTLAAALASVIAVILALLAFFYQRRTPPVPPKPGGQRTIEVTFSEKQDADGSKTRSIQYTVKVSGGDLTDLIGWACIALVEAIRVAVKGGTVRTTYFPAYRFERFEFANAETDPEANRRAMVLAKLVAMETMMFARQRNERGDDLAILIGHVGVIGFATVIGHVTTTLTIAFAIGKVRALASMTRLFHDRLASRAIRATAPFVV